MQTQITSSRPSRSPKNKSSSTCKLFQIMTPVFLWRRIYGENSKTTSSSERPNLQTLSQRVKNKIKQAANGIQTQLGRFTGRGQHHTRETNQIMNSNYEQQHYEGSSIGSRGFEEFSAQSSQSEFDQSGK